MYNRRNIKTSKDLFINNKLKKKLNIVDLHNSQRKSSIDASSQDCGKHCIIKQEDKSLCKNTDQSNIQKLKSVEENILRVKDIKVKKTEELILIAKSIDIKNSNYLNKHDLIYIYHKRSMKILTISSKNNKGLHVSHLKRSYL